MLRRRHGWEINMASSWNCWCVKMCLWSSVYENNKHLILSLGVLVTGDLWGINGNNTNAKFTKINLDFNDVMFLVSLILLFIVKAGHESCLEYLLFVC